MLCETGKYASTEGNWVCQPCQTGTYSNTTGAINCTSLLRPLDHGWTWLHVLLPHV